MHKKYKTMKTHNFNLSITFSDKIYSDKEIAEIIQNIASAISNQIENSENGIAPADSDAFVEQFTVSDVFHESSVTKRII